MNGMLNHTPRTRPPVASTVTVSIERPAKVVRVATSLTVPPTEECSPSTKSAIECAPEKSR